jgi:hypothetical protein
MSDLTKMSEQELREFTLPRIESMAELGNIIEQLTNREHDYGTCVYAMSIAATAAFYYVAGRLGVTGFQASCADMNILTRTRGMKGPWAIQDYSNLLYPQYADSEHFPGSDEILAKYADYFSDAAAKLLANDNTHTHPNVKAWWEKLTMLPPQKEES